jgi:hypothetical protein
LHLLLFPELGTRERLIHRVRSLSGEEVEAVERFLSARSAVRVPSSIV